MSVAKKLSTNGNRKLNIQEVATALFGDGRIRKGDLDKLIKTGKLMKLHPLLQVLRANVARDRENENKLMDLDELSSWLATNVGLKYYEIDPLKLDIEAITKLLPKAYIKRIGVLPVEVHQDKVIFATSEPFDRSWYLDTSSSIKKDIELRFANPDKIEHCIEEFYEVRSAISNMEAPDDLGDVQQLDKMLSSEKGSFADEGNVAKVVDWIFQFARSERATDIHLEPRDGKAQMRFRIDGTLRVVYKYEPKVFLPVVSRLKIMADLKVDEKRRPQDGRIKRKVENGRTMEMRISTIPTHYGEKMVIRIFDPQVAGANFDDLGFNPEDISTWKDLIGRTYGIVLVTGPTGSGKTTTLQSTLDYLAAPEVNICTVEDPVEIVNEQFTQMQVHDEINLTFANSIRAFLRQDPDIIMVGEIRDRDAANMAIQASLTGHLVLSTLHTNTALGAITRLIDLGVEYHLLNASLLGILAQRLVKILCPECKEKIKTPSALWRTLVEPFKVAMPEFVYKSVGCRACKNSGYKGRICIYEMVPMNDVLRDAIHPNIKQSELETLVQGKYLPIRLNGAQKVLQGKTTIEEVLRVAL